MKNFQIGDEVVRTKGTSYLIGVKGVVIGLDDVKNRVHVKWPKGFGKSWVSIESVEAQPKAQV